MYDDRTVVTGRMISGGRLSSACWMRLVVVVVAIPDFGGGASLVLAVIAGVEQFFGEECGCSVQLSHCVSMCTA